MPDIRQTVEEFPESPDAQAPGDNAPAHVPAAQGQPAGPPAPPAERAGGDAARGDVDQDAPPGDVDEDALRGDVDELVAAAAQRDEYLALAQRTQADFENYRKRVARDSAAAQERGLIKLASELLGALDNLDRALQEADQGARCEGPEDGLLAGVRLVRGELHAGLARVGIESFSPRGEVFDPAEHEAVAQQPVEGAQSGTVVEVFQPGYRLGSNVIRPARVLVAA